ncbi:MAG: NUDIX hydrolase, partial [Nocardioidaceae bacterium]|nr:NUDIX hydrolase [Nocardioidaceae bacterium]
EVTEVAWVPLGELDERLAYADERRLVRRAAELLADRCRNGAESA